jgi:hypothetical protein
MHAFLKRNSHWLRTSWLWPLVLLALPNCGLSTDVTPGPPPAFDPGPAPISSVVMCDIPKVPNAGSNGCANSTETGFGISMSRAAIALAQGEKASIALDFSKAATTACGGPPRKTEMQGPYPDGYAACLNCPARIPQPYADGNAVCVAQCIDLVHQTSETEPMGGAEAFCQANAHVSTNFDKTTCYGNACGSDGKLRGDFVDPRRAQEPVKWTEQNGTKGGASGALGNSVTRTAGRSGLFDAGSFSAQTITHGDAWVEFDVSDNTKAYALGVSPGATDTDETLADIPFALVLQNDGQVHISENGQIGAPLGPYAAGERFRVRVIDKNDGSKTATISASRLIGACTPGTVCNEMVIATEAGASPAYPLRVDASLVDPGAILENVTMVRLQ